MHVHNDERCVQSISPYSVRMRENMDQKNSEYGHFSRSEKIFHENMSLKNPKTLRKF